MGASIPMINFSDEQRRKFIDLIRGRRLALGKTQLEVEREIRDLFYPAIGRSISQSTLAKIEQGPYEGMPFILIMIIMQYYNISLQEMLNALDLNITVTDEEKDFQLESLFARISKMPQEDREVIVATMEIFLKGLTAS